MPSTRQYSQVDTATIVQSQGDWSEESHRPPWKGLYDDNQVYRIEKSLK